MDRYYSVRLSYVYPHNRSRLTRQWHGDLLVCDRQVHSPNLQLPHHKLSDRRSDHVPSFHATTLHLPSLREGRVDQLHASVRDKPLLVHVQHFSDVLRVPFAGVPSQRCHAATTAAEAQSRASTPGRVHILVPERFCCSLDDSDGPARVRKRRPHSEAVPLSVDQPEPRSLRPSLPGLLRHALRPFYRGYSRDVLAHIPRAWHPHGRSKRVG